ncbi:MAG TPA: TlpA disulfide reductase family protein [Flavisolibacter sp.]|nr:TlpA disulfide reductase family protein [Flavisolibacter sp.]
MKQILIFGALGLGLAITACSNNDNKETSSTETKEQMSADSNTAAASPATETATDLPAFTVQDAKGNTINLQELKGKKVFVNLWASWCPPCRREMPSIEKLAKSVDSSKVSFVMLSMDENFDKAKAFVKQQQLSLPVFYPAENLPALLNVNSIPTTFIFDENGKLIRRIDGGNDYDSQTFRELLQ